ncbi:MAG: preprotein translocase subunit SecG [Gammaproteobacteria bacterium]|nr:preprotein translocase subunit SecG [Gammaproteobacteria bacterium]
MLVNILTAALVLVAVMIIVLVMLQQGKGADAGAAFGAGGAGSVFGASGAGNFLSRTTAILATVFFILSLTLAHLGSRNVERNSVLDGSSVLQTEQRADEGSDKPVSPTASQASSDTPSSPSESSPSESPASAGSASEGTGQQ